MSQVMFIQTMNLLMAQSTVYELKKVNDKFFTWNCRFGIKNQWWKHRIGLMIKRNLLSIQDNAKCVPLSKPEKEDALQSIRDNGLTSRTHIFVYICNLFLFLNIFFD